MNHQIFIVTRIYKLIRTANTIVEGETPNAGPTYRDLEATIGFYADAFPALHACACNLYNDYLGLDK